MTDLTDLNPIGRFDDRAADYVKYRPTYPSEAIDTILGGLGAPRRLLAADVGAGTGISARLLGNRGVQVVAVEPSEGMRRAADAHKSVVWTPGRAEATGLFGNMFDLVLCAQSFHWFRVEEALVEFARIIKRSGRLALMWNRRSKTDPFTAGYRHAIRDAGGETTAETTEFDPEVISRAGWFSPPERTSFPNLQRLDLDGLIGRARSASYVPKDGPAGERLVDLLRALYERHADSDGFVTLVYETEVYCSKRT